MWSTQTSIYHYKFQCKLRYPSDFKHSSQHTTDHLSSLRSSAANTKIDNFNTIAVERGLLNEIIQRDAQTTNTTEVVTDLQVVICGLDKVGRFVALNGCFLFTTCSK